jgi:uncharacterized protein (UPF0332 family)
MKLNLKKLSKLKILQIVEPSENLKESYFQKSDESLFSSKVLHRNEQYNDAIALSYFSMYNSLLALLHFCGIKSENHNASIFLLKKVFGMNNTEIKTAKTERKDKQYYPSFLTNKKESAEAIDSAERFNSEIADFAEKLTNSRINEIRTKMRDLLK